MAKKMYVKLDDARKVCETNSAPGNKKDWVEVEDFNVELGDTVKADLTVEKLVKLDKDGLWRWAQGQVIDSDTSAITSRWVKCINIGAFTQMTPSDWAELDDFRIMEL